MEKFKFTPEQGYQDGTAYPNPTSENDTREQLMRPLFQLRDFINLLIDDLPVEIIGGDSLNRKLESLSNDILTEVGKTYVNNSAHTSDINTVMKNFSNYMTILAAYEMQQNINTFMNDNFVTKNYFSSNYDSLLLRFTNYLLKNQGSGNAGKFLKVSSSGDVVCEELSGSSMSEDDLLDFLIKYNELKLVLDHDSAILADENGHFLLM